MDQIEFLSITLIVCRIDSDNKINDTVFGSELIWQLSENAWLNGSK